MPFGRPSAQTALAKRLIKAWAIERFALAEDTAVMVAELDCLEPGCPPHETVIAFWDASKRRHQFKVMKAAAAVTRADVDALGSPGDDPLAVCC